jgi:hypothetical protein
MRVAGYVWIRSDKSGSCTTEIRSKALNLILAQFQIGAPYGIERQVLSTCSKVDEAQDKSNFMKYHKNPRYNMQEQ